MSSIRDLFVLHNDDGTFVDHSQSASDYLRDDFSLNFIAAEDEILLGLRKPFYSVYLELTTAALADMGLSFEFSNGTSFSSLGVNDNTRGLKRSGFMIWEREIALWKSQIIDGKDLFWLKIKSNTDATLFFRGINLVFSNDSDLEAEQRQISRFVATGDSSFIAYHVAARNEIMQRLRNSGNATQTFDGTLLNKIDQWDILDFEQLRQASKFLTLAKIMFDVSDNVDDKYYQRWRDYTSEYQKAFKLFFLSLDFNDDGIQNESENQHTRSIQVVKV